MELIVNERIDNNFEVMQKVRLKHIVKISKGKKSTEVSLSNLRYIQIGDLRNDDNLKYAEQNKSNVLCTKNDILIAWDGANAGIIGYNLEGAVGSTLAKLVINDNYKIFPNFLGRFLQTKSKSLRDNCTGATIPHISKSELENIEIPLPDLSTQQKIAEILDTADQLRQFNKQLIEKYDALTQSLFLEIFGDPVRNEKGWEKSKLSDNSKIRIGPFGSLLHVEDYIENGTPLVNPTHIKKGKIEIDNKLTISKDKLKELETYRLKTNDLILGRRGEMGRCAIVTINEDGFLCGTGSIFIRPKNNLNINYLYKVISSNSFKQVLENSAKGVTMKNLSSKVVGDLEIPLPPIEIQNNFIKSIENIETQKQQAQEALEKSEDLFQSLLQRAFKGELN